MDNLNIKNRFHIYTGYKEDNGVKNALQAGEAYSVDCEQKPYYIIKMWAFPKEFYYLVGNSSGDGSFTLFAKKVGVTGTPNFRRPVGFAYISQDLKKHLEIQFTFPRQRVFMSLFPDQTTLDSLLSEDGGVAI